MQIGPAERVGRSFGGYRVERLLGRGGMGSVYAASAPRGGAVVLKFMETALDPKQRKRFQREAEALLRIRSHPNVVSVHHVEMESEVPYLVMDLIEGLPLSGLVQRRGALPPAEAARIAADVARGLAFVHAYGLIHRDVKPDNVVVTPEGRACLVDFGVTKDQFQTSLTRPGQLIGTAPYIAPELWEGQRPTPAADVFSLGATLYHISVGHPPFAGEELTDLSDLILEGDYALPSERLEGFSLALEQVIVQALEPELRFRYRRASELADDLERVVRGEPVSEPALIRPDGSRVGLLGLRRASLGSDPRGQVPLCGAGIAARHAELRRTASGYVLADLSGGATLLDGAKMNGLEPLSDGACLELARVALRFADPRGEELPPPLVPADPWGSAPALVLDALIEIADSRAITEILIRLAPNEDAEARVREALADLVEPALLEQLLDERRAELARAEHVLWTALDRASGHALGPNPPAELAPWLAWWDRVRARAPVQLCANRPALRWRLAAEGGANGIDLDGSGGVVIGRDVRSHLPVDDKTVSRLHASLVPLQLRWLLRDEGSSYGVKVDERPVEIALVDAGATIRLGDVRLSLTRRPGPPLAGGDRALDPRALWILQRGGHRAAARSLLAALRAEQDTAWVEHTGSSLFPGDPARARAFAERLGHALRSRADLARAALPQLLGARADDLAGWEALAARAAASLGPQVIGEDQGGA